MIPDRDYFVAKDEVEQRRRQAAEAHAAREARHAAEAARTEQVSEDETARGAFGWLRRLAGARH